MIFNDKYILKEIHSNSNCIPVIFHGQDMKNIDIARWVDDHSRYGERQRMKYDHTGIPTKERFQDEIDLPHLKMTVSDHRNNPFGIQWQRFWEDASYPELVKEVPHVAFQVDDLDVALRGQKVIIEPNSPSEGVLVAFIEVNGAPVELLQYSSPAEGG